MIVSQEYELVPVEQLSPHPDNPRRGNLEVLGESVGENGFYGAIVAQRSTGHVLAGNHRLLAAQGQGMDQVPVVWVDVDDDRARRILLVDNRANDLAGYDDGALLALLRDVPDLAGTGYTAEDLLGLTGNTSSSGAGLTDVDDEPEPPAVAFTQPGDLWQLGPHRVLCADALAPASYDRLLDGELAHTIWTDPPYNVAVAGGTHDPRDRKNHGKGPRIVNDAMGDQDFYEFLLAAFTAMLQRVHPGGAAYVCHADTEGINFRVAFRQAGFFLHQCVIWAKQEFVFGRSDYHWQHEPILYGWRPGAAHTFLGERNQSTVWNIDRPMRSAMEHPTQKPVALVSKALANSVPPGGLVLDPFAGGGSTLMAAQQLGARTRLMDLDPVYVDVICRRWQEHTGELPINMGTGEAHDFTREVSHG